ncbi:MAG: tetratricopeptide repeat protein [Anaerolineae bacterium]|jgi:DNA-binding SARP family transcriptional activator
MSDQDTFSGADRHGVLLSPVALPLIKTKIRIPRRREDLLPRRRLLNFFHSNLDCKLILISAPAGFGKTSLLTDLAHDSDLPVCWYTLDRFDRDLHTFVEYLVASISFRFPEFGRRSRTYLQQAADLGSNLYPLVATIVQEIYDTIPEYFFLVLDDHHTVEDQEQINTFLDLFLTYIDENCHMIIASRTLPVLPNLSLLVARRQAAGLSIDELRFTPQEIQFLARQNYDLELDLRQASNLAERTGGWVTGLLLTSAHHWAEARDQVAVRGRINVDLYDYLSRQVLDRQPSGLRDFLQASSVLEEFAPDLCAALGIKDAPSFMEQVRMRNLFVVEFEGEQGQLRYHDLFRDFLRDSLYQEDRDRYLELTLRAARAYRARGEWERAVSRYLALEQYGPVSEILHSVGRNLFEAGRWDTLAGWIDALPEAESTAHPQIVVHRAKIDMERGHYDQALALFQQAQDAFHAQGDVDGRAQTMAMKGYVLRFQGSYGQAIEQGREALALIDDASPKGQALKALVHKNVGICHLRLGELSRGREALEQARQYFEGAEGHYDAAQVHHDLGLCHELMGDLEGAATHYRAALARWQTLGNPAPWANTLNGLGVVYALQGRYTEAAQTLDEALARTREAGDPRVEAFVRASQGDLLRDLGAYEQARQAYEDALGVAGRARVGFILTYAWNAMGKLACLMGDLEQAAVHLTQAMALAREHGSDYETGFCHASLGLLAVEQEDLAGAVEHLERAIAIFEGGGFQRDLALAYLYRAYAAFRAGDEEAARADLGRSLALADRLGFDEFLVVEGNRLEPLLRRAPTWDLDVDHVSDLLERIEAHKDRLAEQSETRVEVERPPVLKIYALGQPQVELGGEDIQWTTVQSRDLLFCLLQYPQGLRKEEVGALFWPDHPPRRLDGIFRSSLYRLRRAIFRDVVVFEDGLYHFSREANYWFDVQAFEQLLDQAGQAAVPEAEIDLLEQALDLYRGDYLEGAYADWCALERERLRERRLNALEALAGLHAGRGDFQHAIDEYQRLVTHDPYREPAYRELMRCHYRLGDRVSAVRHYQSCAEILREDLGLDPSDETEELYQRIIA